MPPLTTRVKVLLALVIVLGLFFLHDLTKRKGPSKASRPLSVAAVQALSSTVPEEPAASDLIPERRWEAMQERAASGWGRDPFLFDPSCLKDASHEEPHPTFGRELKVTGIVWNGRGAYAVINDFLVRTGDEVAGAKVIEIRRDQVILLRNGRQYVLKLGE